MEKKGFSTAITLIKNITSMFIFLGREGGGAKRNSEGNAEGKRFKENSISLTYNIFLKKKNLKNLKKKQEC